ncbi:MAG: tRNA (cytidine(34)-2'-O)-methyltransferase [Clostridia bacterium]|nr:tRNA (cytidine(34)-2'-O)-methyltransferase [Clostridia bacterium]MBQ4610910.1 tRNA (cytidine(34)-2'-O)-methyltransferase [Clostridia bacterium]MBQ6703216.1 tRNA (cytidine(34)-2'-O)-methyltransferase [Clostridia bacterium]
MFNIVLVNPEIPPNTGNISRTCAVTGTRLHLVRPFGFEISDRTLKRAGLDYWKDLDVCYYDSFEELEEAYPSGRFFLTSTHAKRSYAEVKYKDGDFIVFGRETAGLGPELLARREKDTIRIPMLPEQRSLNLSNSAAIVLYEALRQTGFMGLR